MKRRILFVNGHMNIGGVEKSLLDILRHLDYGKYDVDLLLLEEPGHFISEVPSEVSIILRDLTNTYGSVAGSLRRCFSKRDWLCCIMRMIILLEKIAGKRVLKLAGKLLIGGKVYDCAVGFRPGICADLVAYAFKAENKLTWWHHGDLEVMGAAQQAECEKTYGIFNYVVAVSDGCLKMLERAMPSVSHKLMVVPNMLDVKAVREKAELFHPYHNKPELRLVTVGRLSPEKHVENAVFASEQLVQHGLKDFHWHIVGEGPERKKIEQLIQEKHLAHVMSLEGLQPNPYPYIKHATLYVHASYVESQGLTILEAMALGVPCIVTRSLGPEEFIHNGENGILVEQNVESLIEGILKVIQSPELYKALKHNTHCPPEYSCENVTRKVEALISG